MLWELVLREEISQSFTGPWMGKQKNEVREILVTEEKEQNADRCRGRKKKKREVNSIKDIWKAMKKYYFIILLKCILYECVCTYICSLNGVRTHVTKRPSSHNLKHKLPNKQMNKQINPTPEMENLPSSCSKKSKRFSKQYSLLLLPWLSLRTWR